MDQSRKLRNLQRAGRWLYGGLLILLVLHTLLFSAFTSWQPDTLRRVARLGTAMGLGVDLLLAACIVLEAVHCWQRALLAALLTVLRWRAPITFQSGMLLDTVLMATLSDLGTEKSNGIACLLSRGLYLAILGLLLLLGGVRDATTLSDKSVWIFRVGHSWGMLHPNSLAVFLMTTWLMLWVALRPQSLWIMAAFYAAGAFGVLALTMCRTVAALMVLFPFLYMLCRGIGRSRHAGLLRWAALCPALALGLTVLLGLFADPLSGLYRDGAFWTRFYELRILQKDGLTLFGANPSEPAFFDNVYLWMLTYCGLIPTVGVLGLVSWMLLRLAGERRAALLSVGLLLLLYGLMENTAAYVMYCFVPLLAFAKAHSPKEKEIVKRHE